MERKERIETAALELFCERGFEGATVPAIAQRAGVSVGLIYRYFTNKEDLVNHLYRLWKGRLREHLETRILEVTGYRQQFRLLCRLVLQFARQQARAFTFLEAHHHGPYLDEVSLELARSGRGRVVEFLRMGQQQGLLKSVAPEILLCILWGSLKEVAAQLPELSERQEVEVEACCWQALQR